MTEVPGSNSKNVRGGKRSGRGKEESEMSVGGVLRSLVGERALGVWEQVDFFVRDWWHAQVAPHESYVLAVHASERCCPTRFFLPFCGPCVTFFTWFETAVVEIHSRC